MTGKSKADSDVSTPAEKHQTSEDAKGTAKVDELISLETLRESPVQWPERFPGMEEFVTMSDTPIHRPSVDCSQIPTKVNMAAINQFARLPPEQLVEKIKAMHDQIYRLGLRESKEMTRGKLLGIFDRDRLTKAKALRN
ncbi:PREDICTED: protein lin-52 homolog isoform X1 [Drosophila arizonae]|uniref:Protein lin-52 homolog isoform X1 n=1 Tax=Drosophila arizonae TaxID=7263 RepID=A0ABM1PSI9_DROAR|nr:PREDICTED: protein lin-52 homolog isoform X1 [Drosophila arizonae]